MMGTLVHIRLLSWSKFKTLYLPSPQWDGDERQMPLTGNIIIDIDHFIGYDAQPYHFEDGIEQKLACTITDE